jgi:hypothetical protein
MEISSGQRRRSHRRQRRTRRAEGIDVCAFVLINYGLSVVFVFHEHRIGNRYFEFAGFLGIGLCGLAVKEAAIEGLVHWCGLNYKLANIPAVGAAFIFNFGVRRALLFSRPR